MPYVYVRNMPNNAEHKVHARPSTTVALGKESVVAQKVTFPKCDSSIVERLSYVFSSETNASVMS